GAAVDLMPLGKWGSAVGWSGLEPMAGIPASVGGAVRMNAGGRFGTIGDVVLSAKLMDPDGGVEDWDRARLAFGYRSSAVDDHIVVSVELALHRDDPAVTDARFKEFFEYKTSSQPLSASSAGCIFKNPANESAGALIDRAGLKGTRVGGACVSTHHANFIVTEGNATASDVLALIDVIRASVADQFGTELEVEVDIW
ncbi:MAG: UDP-N-acetylmuramate dehydrogenase, partial [Planctomycetes bacterium]|nr:UDP-N-acetylmuramate dehydrogenase [Planctomycetota bacterium]